MFRSSEGKNENRRDPQVVLDQDVLEKHSVYLPVSSIYQRRIWISRRQLTAAISVYGKPLFWPVFVVETALGCFLSPDPLSAVVKASSLNQCACTSDSQYKRYERHFLQKFFSSQSGTSYISLRDCERFVSIASCQLI